EGRDMTFVLDNGEELNLAFSSDKVEWSGKTFGQTDTISDPYDAVPVREGVYFLNLPFESRAGEAVSVMWSEKTGQGVIVHSTIDPVKVEGEPQVKQAFFAATINGYEAKGETPAESRDLIGKRNIYRYSPNHLYEHVYMSTERYAWQNLQ